MIRVAASRASGEHPMKQPVVTVPCPETPSAPGEEEAPGGESSLAIVGIGASAGGLAAFEAFFGGMPQDEEADMAFVLVQHLAPDHKSILTELIRRCTRMPVFEVEDGMEVRRACIYIIPPNRDMAFLNGRLHLLEPSAPRGLRLPIDFFFRSLAHDQRERAIGIVLSGTGSDGTLGLRTIKGEGGMAMAQLPGSAEYDGMPRSAIATGLVDYQLAPAEMASQLLAYVTHAFHQPATLSRAPEPMAGHALARIAILLRARTGHDFSQYKPNTILRRIQRRLAVHQIETIEGYVAFLQQTPGEVDALFHDLLIGVTSFFRDTEAFQALEHLVIPKLLEGRPSGSPVRVWSAGCSTGEEPYSVAMLLKERMEALKETFKVQVFATDIDPHAVAAARAGIYPASIAADVSPERLARFFTVEPGGGAYRIQKVIRDMLVFSEQDLIKDPPFSRLDLICCRNLLIYLGGDLQKKIIPLFHYALNPGGFLFQGTSETVGDFGDLFQVVDRKAKIYQRREDGPGTPRAHLGRPLAHMARPSLRPAGKPVPPDGKSLRDLTEQGLLDEFAPAGALVNGQGDILYVHGHSGLYLELRAGEPGINNILNMAREGLRQPLATALHQASTKREIVRSLNLRVKTDGHYSRVNVTIRPIAASQASRYGALLFLVIFDAVRAAGPVASEGPETGQELASLKQDLRAKEDYLKASNEELETSNEEFKSSNEEMQSMNEELQSANEELETSREELQSVNEELATVNAELQTKVSDLSLANNDMNNLLAGTGIGTVFLDQNLRILRFTPAATGIINLIPADLGRPVGHIVSNLVGYDSLVADVKTVLDTLATKEEAVQTREGKWFTMRIQLYRTLDNVIEGAVITFVNITDLKRVEDELKVSQERIRQLTADLARQATAPHESCTP